MLPSASILQQIGFGVLFAVAVVWAVAMTRLLRRGRYEAAMRRDRREMRERYGLRGPGGLPSAAPGLPWRADPRRRSCSGRCRGRPGRPVRPRSVWN
ncbi:hypothetical protein PQR15_20895 [Streptomyces lydicus]|nr:hypothetical protein [Streptomyces lydicus]